MKLATESRQSPASLFQKAKIWPSRQNLFQLAQQRLNRDQLKVILRMISELEKANRHFDVSLAWQWLQTLTIAFKGATSLRFTLPTDL